MEPTEPTKRLKRLCWLAYEWRPDIDLKHFISVNDPALPEIVKDFLNGIKEKKYTAQDVIEALKLGYN